jgi:hypothetical protein
MPSQQELEQHKEALIGDPTLLGEEGAIIGTKLGGPVPNPVITALRGVALVAERLGIADEGTPENLDHLIAALPTARDRIASILTQRQAEAPEPSEAGSII